MKSTKNEPSSLAEVSNENSNKTSNAMANFNGLLIVDGKETPTSNLKSMNPLSIKSMSVLKDAEATKQYGEKGKNGVIIITSKN